MTRDEVFEFTALMILVATGCAINGAWTGFAVATLVTSAIFGG